jgi:uncharacterized protein (TIGR00266 family)
MQYTIEGGNFPVAILELTEGESVAAEAGAMSWMSPNMQMETKAGGLTKLLGRAFSGENLFENVYTAVDGKGLLAMASRFPGSIRAFHIRPGSGIILQKRAFLARETGVSKSVFFQQSISSGLFGGEGFIMEKLDGEGLCFGEFDGSVIEYDLAQGQEIIVSTGCLAAMSATCSLTIQSIPGIKNALFGGESFFNTKVTGPGHIWLQSMPLPEFAAKIAPLLPQSGK